MSSFTKLTYLCFSFLQHNIDCVANSNISQFTSILILSFVELLQVLNIPVAVCLSFDFVLFFPEIASITVFCLDTSSGSVFQNLAASFLFLQTPLFPYNLAKASTLIC